MKRFLGIDSGLGVLLDKAPNEELDYGFVMECLKAYKNPRIFMLYTEVIELFDCHMPELIPTIQYRVVKEGQFHYEAHS